MISEKTIVTVSVLLFSFLLFIGVIYLLATDVDYFINHKTTSGKLETLRDYNNKIELKISYYDEYKNADVQKEKRFKSSYRYILQRKDSNIASITYTKWFDQIFVNDVKKPKALILIFEIIMLITMAYGIKWSFYKIFFKKSNFF